jgi:ABC-type dipeptide/oligopeptide/nickel transport system permease subunit
LLTRKSGWTKSNAENQQKVGAKDVTLSTTRLIGIVVILVAVAIAAFAPALATHNPFRSSIDFLQGPSAVHWFGTDDLGRDTFSRVVYGARTSLAVGVGAAFVATLLGVPIGLVAGYFGGKVDGVQAGLSGRIYCRTSCVS